MSQRSRSSRTRTCGICSGPISERNQTGICARNFECRSEQQRRRNVGKKVGKRKTQSAWLLPPAYDLDTGEEIVDNIAVDILVEGSRHVAHTITERKEAMERLIRRGHTFREIAEHIGTSPSKLKPLFAELGYELIPRRSDGTYANAATEIRKIKEGSR